jgi:hypothetical protein
MTSKAAEGVGPIRTARRVRTKRRSHSLWRENRKMPRKRFTADQTMRERVLKLARVGIPQEYIAKIVGCSPKTLRITFRDELDRATLEANAEVAGFLYEAAKQGNVIAQIFWLKTRAKWREADAAASGSTDNAGPNSGAVVVLPDNERDPQLTEVLRKAQEAYFAKKKRNPER